MNVCARCNQRCVLQRLAVKLRSLATQQRSGPHAAVVCKINKERQHEHSAQQNSQQQRAPAESFAGESQRTQGGQRQCSAGVMQLQGCSQQHNVRGQPAAALLPKCKQAAGGPAHHKQRQQVLRPKLARINNGPRAGSVQKRRQQRSLRAPHAPRQPPACRHRQRVQCARKQHGTVRMRPHPKRQRIQPHAQRKIWKANRGADAAQWQARTRGRIQRQRIQPRFVGLELRGSGPAHAQRAGQQQ